MRQRILIASSNRGKIAEIERLLNQLAIDLIAQDALDIPAAPEDAPSFVENAIAKARAGAQTSGLPTLADDSGLEVDALAGLPGVHSARYAGRHGDDGANIAKLLAALAARPGVSRRARFRCVAVFLAHPDHPAPLIAEGVWEGEIAAAPRGDHGFGYDPIFLLPDRSLTAAELNAEEKNRLSHRAQAFTQLRERLAQFLALK
ncbi:MAG: RdgB/HAM1 family non-canonical purine NTP pyrophosphatase [Gammaproteobacteria bacterium]